MLRQKSRFIRFEIRCKYPELTAILSKILQVLHNRRKTSNRTTPEIISKGKSTGHDYRFGMTGQSFFMPDSFCRNPQNILNRMLCIPITIGTEIVKSQLSRLSLLFFCFLFTKNFFHNRVGQYSHPSTSMVTSSPGIRKRLGSSPHQHRKECPLGLRCRVIMWYFH